MSAIRVCLLLGFAIFNSGCADKDQATVTESRAGTTGFESFDRPRESAQVFISGHSLIDRPTPDYLGEIARSLDTPIQWNSQHVGGSSILRRTRGEVRDSDRWEGYREGKNREGEGLDVVEELANPKTVNGKYDVLLITEQHGMLETLVWNDTVRHLRHYHERLIDGNPDAVTYFYESWISLNDKADPTRWIEYEKMISPVWQCVATRINASLEAEGRRDRIISLPAGAALAHLIETATTGSGLASISLASKRETVDRLLEDVVHPTRLANYYLAAATYAAIFRRSPVGSWFPEGEMSLQQAQTLQRLAADFMARYYADYRPLSLAECRALIADNDIIEKYWTYIRDAYWMEEAGPFRANIRWLRRRVEWSYTLTREDHRNPFFSAQPDAGYWFAAPK